MKQPLFVRRCHVCGEFNESTHDITKCHCCQKSLLPFYYFDKRKIMDLSDNEVRPAEERDKDTGYGPIRGLTAFW
jgi:hypothetical protein